MPFGADAYLAKKQTQVARATGSESPQAYDPDAYLASKGSPQEKAPAPEPGAAAQALDQALPMAAVAGQGAALGYGKQLNAGLQAGMGAVDQAVNGQNNFGDQSDAHASVMTRIADAISNVPANYSRAKKEVQAQIDKARIAHPVAAALTEIAASIPPSILAGSTLKAAGMVNTGAQAATIGGAYGYGASQNEGLDRVYDAGKAAAMGYGIAKGVQLGGAALSAVKNVPIEDLVASEYESYGKPIVSIAKAAVKDTPYGLDFQPKLSEGFQIGKEMKAVLTDPNVQAQVTSELNAQPERAEQIINLTKDRLGKTWEPILAEHGTSAKMDVDPLLNKAYTIANDIATEGNTAAEPLKSALQKRIMNFASNLRPADSGVTGIKGSVNLKQLTDFQQDLGDIIYRQKAYDSVPQVKRAAARLWGLVADSASKLDETQGSGGALADINKVYKALYGMTDNMIKGTDIRAMVNPQAVGAENRFEQFVKPFEDLPANLRQELAPEMHSYLSDAFPKVFTKAKIMVAATTGKDDGLIQKVLNMGLIRAMKPINIANRAGQLSNVQYNGPSIAAGAAAAAGPAQAALPVVAPSIAGQMSGGGAGGQQQQQ